MLLISPPGVAAYVHLDKPDPGPKDRPATTAKYKVTVVYPKETSGDYQHWFDDLIERHLQVEGSIRSCPCRDGDKLKAPGGGPSKFPGAYIVKFTTLYPVDIVDCNKQHLAHNMRVQSGDLIRVAYTESLNEGGAVPGLFLRMNAVQLVEKRALSQSHFAGQAFDTIEGGFTVEDWNKIHQEAADAALQGDQTDF